MKLLLLVMLLFNCSINAEGLKNIAENEIQIRYVNSDLKFSSFLIPKIIKKDIEKAVHQKFFRDKIYYWKIYQKDKLTAIALLDNVYGKTMPITFLVFFDLSGKIVDTKIVKYRESHGGEIGNERWLKQFNNKSTYSSLSFGKDIDGISGATISAKSITMGIKKLLLLAKQILKR